MKAEAHYTTVFDGTHKFFCDLSITDVEGRLDQTRFVRVHRSYIVAVDRITSLRRSGDAARGATGQRQSFDNPPRSWKMNRARSLVLPEGEKGTR